MVSYIFKQFISYCVPLKQCFGWMLFSNLIFNCSPLSGQNITNSNLSIHFGIGGYNLKIDPNSVLDYFYRTQPKHAFEVGLGTDIPVFGKFYLPIRVAYLSQTTSTQRLLAILPAPNDINQSKYRQEHWSDFTFNRLALQSGLSHPISKRINISCLWQSSWNTGIREMRQEKWIAYPAYESVYFEKNRKTVDPNLFRRFDHGLLFQTNISISKHIKIGLSYQTTWYTSANPFLGNWLESRAFMTNTFIHI